MLNDHGNLYKSRENPFLQNVLYVHVLSYGVDSIRNILNQKNSILFFVVVLD